MNKRSHVEKIKYGPHILAPFQKSQSFERICLRSFIRLVIYSISPPSRLSLAMEKRLRFLASEDALCTIGLSGGKLIQFLEIRLILSFFGAAAFLDLTGLQL
jgi:hypothetical protein